MLSQQYQARVVPPIRRLTTQRKNIVEEVAKLCSFDSDSLEEKDNSDDFDLELLEQSLVAYFDRINLSVTLKKLIEVLNIVNLLTRCWITNYCFIFQ